VMPSLICSSLIIYIFNQSICTWHRPFVLISLNKREV
jgi:hypothetical protein